MSDPSELSRSLLDAVTLPGGGDAPAGSLPLWVLISSSANIEAVQRQLGHATAASTLGLHRHLHEDDVVTLADALDRRHAAAATPQAPRPARPDDSLAPYSGASIAIEGRG